MMLKNNPAPILSMRSSYYLKHFMNLLTEASNGHLPISKVYEYTDRWQISDWDYFTEIIMTCHDNFRKELNDVAQQDKDTPHGRKSV